MTQIQSFLSTCPLRTLAVLLFGMIYCVAGATGSSQASELRTNAIVKAIAQARPSVVNIHGEKTVSGSLDQFGHTESRRVNGMGTGVVVDPRGFIVTNHHVVDGVRRIQVTLASGKSYIAKLVSHDKQTDLAIIKIHATEDLPVIKVGTSKDIMTGEDVIAVGNAYGYEHTVTRGIISALHRTVQVSDAQEYRDLIQTDASINPGNSGGPLLNIDGEMIGVNVAVRAGAQGIGFAIPVDKVLEITSRLLSSRQVDRNWHGIVAHYEFGHQPKVVVQRLETGSPAVKGGLKKGDVITEVADVPVKQVLDFQRALLGRKVGEEIKIVVHRDNQPKTLSLVMSSVPTGHIPTPKDRSWDVFGLRLSPIAQEEFQKYKSRYRGGLTVLEVRPGSPASEQGIQVGDILVGMHIWETVSLENVTYVLSRPDLADLNPLKFYILRGSETLYGTMKVALRP